MSEGPLEDRVEAARQRQEWHQSPDYRKAQIACALWCAAGLVGLILTYSIYSFSSKLSDTTMSTTATALYIVAAVAIVLISPTGATLEIRRRRERFRDAKILERYGDLIDEQSKLLDEDHLKLGELWRLSEERLKIYHEIATRQANASFRNAQWAILAGFVVIIVGSGAAFLAKNITISIVVGALGTVGAALSAYIGKTFLRLQENAASHLRSYFDQPREQFRYLAAERLLSHLTTDEQKSTAINELIKSIASADDRKLGRS